MGDSSEGDELREVREVLEGDVALWRERPRRVLDSLSLTLVRVVLRSLLRPRMALLSWSTVMDSSSEAPLSSLADMFVSG